MAKHERKYKRAQYEAAGLKAGVPWTTIKARMRNNGISMEEAVLLGGKIPHNAHRKGVRYVVNDAFNSRIAAKYHNMRLV